MKKKQFILASNTIDKIIDAGAYAKTMYKLKELKKQLVETAEQMVQEEFDLLKKFGGEINEDGRITFVDKETELDFRKAIANHIDEEIEVPINPIELDFEDLGDVKITGAEYDALANGFIKFIV